MEKINKATLQEIFDWLKQTKIEFSEIFVNQSRKLDKLQKNIDILDSDRQLLENIQIKLTAIQETLTLSRQHDDSVKKDLKEDINIIGDRMEKKVEEKVGAIDDKIASKKTIRIIEKTKTISQVFKDLFNKIRG